MTVQITQQPQLVNGRQVVTFTGGDTFEALHAAQAWCKEREISYSAGSARCGGVVGLLHGDFSIAKYHNLTAKERTQLDGTMTGDGREGPVTISIKPRSQP